MIVDTEVPLVLTNHQACLFRKPYPVGSFAGGRVLVGVRPAARQTTRLLELGKILQDATPEERLVAWVDFAGEVVVDPGWFELNLGIPAAQLKDLIRDAEKRSAIVVTSDGKLTSPQSIQRIRAFVLKLLKHQAETTDDAWLDEQSILQRASTTGSADAIQPVLADLIRDKEIVRVNRMIAIASDQTVLSKKQRARMEQLLAMYRDARKPPTLKEASSELDAPIDSIASLIRFATQQRILIDLGNGFFISEEAFRVLCQELQDRFLTTPQASVAEIRDLWQITRKHAIPLLEYCDKERITIREGDARVAGEGLGQLLSQATVESSE